jgi:hypothetical protein
MKNRFQTFLAAMTICAALQFHLPNAEAQGTAFTYQGQLNFNGEPANGAYDFAFALYTAPTLGTLVATPVTNLDLGVTNGLFTTSINFGAAPWTGQTLYLEILVRTNGSASFAALNPLQEITPAPYAIAASNLTGTLPATQLAGSILNASLPASPTFSGTVTAASLSGNGANVTNVNAQSLGGLNAANFWQLGGNNVSSSQFFGSTDNEPLRIRVNNVRALMIQTNPADSANFIGGSPANTIDNGVEGSVIAGGGTTNFLGVASSNHISGDFSSIGGGSGNWIQSGADHSFIGSGLNNLISSGAYESVLGGGETNSISGEWSFLGGGYGNIVSNSYATVPGGARNVAGGLYSFAAGQSADALHEGAFVWADSQSGAFASTTNNQFNVRAGGGARFVTSGGGNDH